MCHFISKGQQTRQAATQNTKSQVQLVQFAKLTHTAYWKAYENKKKYVFLAITLNLAPSLTTKTVRPIYCAFIETVEIMKRNRKKSVENFILIQFYLYWFNFNPRLLRQNMRQQRCPLRMRRFLYVRQT